MNILLWLATSKTGKTISMCIIAVAAAFAMKSYLEHQGYKKCEQDQLVKTVKQAVLIYDAQVERDKTSSGISTQARSDADEAVAAVDKRTNQAKKEIQDVYSKKPETAPVASCVTVHPVDDRVWREVAAAVDKANTPSR